MSFEPETNHQRILIFLFLVSVFLLALNKIEDTDTWMHLSFGRLIWELKALPAKEPFIYPSYDMPFSYSSWLFGLIYYLAYLSFKIYGVILLKAITVTSAFYILLRDSLRPYKNHVISIIVMTIIVIMTRHRFVERPDTFLMVFLSFSIFSLNAFVYDNKKYIYALPFVHMLWANSHSSINLMFVPFGAFIVGGIIERFINSKLKMRNDRLEAFSKSQLKTIGLIFIASFIASLISPYFISQYTFGAQFLASDWWKQQIIELNPPTWQTTKWPYIVTVAIAISFVLRWIIGGFGGLSLIHLFMVIPFVVLSFTALRFVFLLGIVAGPIVARNISTILEEARGRTKGSKVQESTARPITALVAIWIILYTILTIAKVEPFDDKEKVFGFGINYDFVPEGALGYMDRRNITGRVFNLFQWGGYITWRDFPKRTAFVDGRGYLSGDLLEKLGLARSRHSVLEELYRQYGFESILVEYPIITPAISETLSERDAALSDPGWALVYWDDQSLVYLKRGGRYDSIIKEDEYRLIMPANGLTSMRARLYDENYRVNLLREIKRNINETGSSKAYAFLGLLYNETGLYREAIYAFVHVRDFPFLSHLPEALNGIAYAYGNLGDLDKAIRYFRKSLSINRDATTLYNLGIACIKKGDKKAAIKYLKEALNMNSNLISIYPQLIGIYQELGREDDVREMVEMYERARAAREGEGHFKNGIKAYFERRFDVAAEEFEKSIKANPSNPAPYSNLGYIFFDTGRLDRAYEYHKKAIDIDPNFANSHYGLALIYKRWGDMKMAKKHWEEYLRVEPSGYYSRRAREEIEAIK